MTSELEFIKAVTDLLIAVVCVPCIALLCRQRKCLIRTLWLKGLSLLAVASVMGFAAHGFILDGLTLRILWAFLYPVMFEASRAFILCLLTVYGEGFPTESDRGVLLWGEIILCSAAVIIRLVTGANTIMIYAVYAAIAISLVLVKIPNHKHRISRHLVLDAFILIIIVTLAILSQVFIRKVRYVFSLPFNGVIIAHILLAAVPLSIYQIAKCQILSNAECDAAGPEEE